MHQNNNTKEPKDYRIYIPRTGRFVTVSKEIYYEYYRPVWSIQKRAKEHGQCTCPKAKLWKCDGDCQICPYRSSGDTFSLDTLFTTEDGEITRLLNTLPDTALSVEDAVVEAAVLKELYAALAELDPDGRKICTMLMEGKSQREIAGALGIRQSTFHYREKKLLATLRERLKDIF